MAKETMTENEAIKQLEFDKKMICFDSTHGEDIPLERVSEQNRLTYEADCVAIKALEEVQQYRAIGTVEECREAVEKQKAKRPDGGRDIDRNDYLICPNCCAIVADSECKWVTSFCPDCGQKLDWSDEE